MAQRPKVDYQVTEYLLLFRLQYALAKNENLNNSLKSLSRKLDISLQLVRICANRLESEGFCKIETVEEFGEHSVTGNEASYNEIYLEVTEAGIAEVEGWPAEKYKQTAQHSDLTLGEDEFESDKGPLRDPLEASLGLDSAPLGEDHTQAPDHQEPELAPASNRVVTLDHNSLTYKDAVAALDSAISSVAGDNEYGDRDPEDKEYRLEILEFGRKLLDGTRVAVNDIKSLLLDTLEYLAKISVAVTKIAAAIAAIKILIGL